MNINLKSKKRQSSQWIVGTGFSRGIGNAFLHLLKKHNFKVIHLGRKETKQEDLFIQWDLLKSVSLNPLNELKKQISGINLHGFFYGVGIMPVLEMRGESETHKQFFWKSHENAMRVNYFSCAELVSEVLPFLLKKESRQTQEKEPPFLAHLSSLAAVDPFEGLELYGISKSAALSYFKWLAKKYTSEQVSIFSLHPGTVMTDMMNDILKNESPEMPIVKVYKVLIKEHKILTPQVSATNIFQFLFDETEKEKRKQAHGILYLADEGSKVR